MSDQQEQDEWQPQKFSQRQQDVLEQMVIDRMASIRRKRSWPASVKAMAISDAVNVWYKITGKDWFKQ